MISMCTSFKKNCLFFFLPVPEKWCRDGTKINKLNTRDCGRIIYKNNASIQAQNRDAGTANIHIPFHQYPLLVTVLLSLARSLILYNHVHTKNHLFRHPPSRDRRFFLFSLLSSSASHDLHFSARLCPPVPMHPFFRS